MSILWIAALFGLCAFTTLWYIGTSMAEKRMVARRVRMLQGYSPVAHAKEQLVRGEFAGKRSGTGEGFKLSKDNIIMVLWLGAGMVLIRLFNYPFIHGVILVVVLPILAMRMLKIFIKKARLERIQRELPGALDLMVVCLEAGLGINSALVRVANELQDSPFGLELKRAADEVNAGIPLEDALRGVAKRSEVTDLHAVIASIIQAQKMGSSLALTFRVQADSAREKNVTRIKEKIHKIPIKILFPLVFFIFPALFVVILGPAFISIMKTLSAAAGG